MKPDHSRVKTMLKDTITLLCKNGLPFKQKFNVEAIIGVTLDDDEVVLLSINEVIRNTVDPEISDDPVSETDSIPNQKHKRKRRRRSSAEKSSPEKQAHMESSDAGQEQFVVVKRENDHSADLQQENYEASQALPQDVNIKQEKSEVICLEEDDDDDDESSESPMYEAYEVGQPGQAQGLGFAGSYGVDGQGFRGDMSWGEASTSSATGNLSQPHNTITVGHKYDIEDSEDHDYSKNSSPESDEEAEEQQGTPRQNRFCEIADDDIPGYCQGNRKKSTIRKTEGAVRLFQSYLTTKDEHRPVHEVPPDDLNKHLAKFFISVRKEDPVNPDYEPSSLKGLQSSLERHLKENFYPHSIINSPLFLMSREAISSRVKELKKKGLGKTPNRKRAPTDEELEQMWDSKALGTSTPESLQRTVWWIICTGFGRRANEENRAMCWGDIYLEQDASGLRFLTCKARSASATEELDNTVYEDRNNPERCPVSIYEIYRSKRPVEACAVGGDFYLQPKCYSDPKSMAKDAVWYKSRPHGINSIKKYMQLICEEAGMPAEVRRQLTNISTRKHVQTTNAGKWYMLKYQE